MTGEVFVLQIKTGDDPTYTDSQRVIYPIAAIGKHVYSPSTKIYFFGFFPGETLPPLTVLQVRAFPSKEIEIVPIIPEFEKLLKLLSDFEPRFGEGAA